MFRHHLTRRRGIAAWLVVLALAMKLLVPTGFMLAGAGSAIRVVPCTGFGPQAMLRAAASASPAGHASSHGMPMHASVGHGGSDHAAMDHAGAGRGDAGKGGDHGKAEMPCTFAGLSAPLLAAADPLLLALAIAFIVQTVFRLAARPRHGRPAFRLRPPLRGPPARA